MAYILQDEIAKAPLPTPEHMLGKGSMMPFNPSNSGGRKLMFGVNLEQRLPLIDPDVPMVSTGFEYQFGIYSSSYITAQKDYEVIAIIPKYSYRPYNHKFYILQGNDGKLTVIESSDYKHLTENYGYLYNHKSLDNLKTGSHIPKGSVILKSGSFDDYDNRMDGKNLMVLYNCSEQTMEDAIILSESAAKKLASPLVHKIKIVINDNDIPLNLYGTKNNYKTFPDIGEEIKKSIVMGYRREKKEEALFSQSYDRLNTLSISDEKIMCSGKVVDIDVYSNDPSKLEGNIYFNQIKFYWDQQLEFSRTLVDTVKPFIEQGIELDYELQKLYYNCSSMLQGKQYFNERVFSNLNIDITVIEEIPVNTGDKCTNRYGGKGVVSEVRKDYLMPKTYNGETFDALINICGVYGRENGGQLFEATVTAVGRNLLNYWSEESLDTGTCFKMYLEYLKIVSPSMYEETLTVFADKSDDVISEFIGSMVVDGEINVAIEPMSENMTIDKVAQLYKTFPWMDQEYILVPLPDSNGNIQYVTSHRPVIAGYVYYYRLKQYAKEKFSVTSMSATNIRNENSRNKASKSYKALYSRTPIRFGDMEIGDLSHLGPDIVVQMLMLYATSPLARDSYEKLMTGNPFEIDINLDNTASNRSAEIVETYLKTIGKRIIFRKVKKEIVSPIEFHPIKFYDKGYYSPIVFWNKDIGPESIENIIKLRDETKGLIYPILFNPITFKMPIDEVINKLKEDEAERLKKLAEELGDTPEFIR